MQLGKYTFSPTLLPSLAVIILVPLFIGLGLWQLDRGREKDIIQAQVENNLQSPVLTLEQDIENNQHFLYRRAEVYGHFEPERVYLLDNAIWQGRPGYLVQVPFRYAGDKHTILVNRGWIAMGPSRGELPTVATGGEPMQLRGILSLPPGKLLELDASAKLDTQLSVWPQVIQQVDIAQIGQQLGYTMAPLILQIDPGHPVAFAQGWRAYVDGSQKHVSYAVQWFSFAAIMLLLYVVLNSRHVGSNTSVEK